MFEVFDLAVPLTVTIFLKTLVIVFVGTLANYLLLTVPTYFYFKKNSGNNAIRLQEANPFPGQIAHEIRWSLITIAIYAVLTTCLIVVWRMGAFPQFYVNPLQHGWVYLGVSFVLVLLVQDVYFYFGHRLLHSRKLIRYHGVHHRSKVPSPFVMYTFHPVEALVHFVRLPVMLLLFPVCPLVLVITEGFISNVINAFSHTNHEPKFLRKFKLAHGWTSATIVFHDLHHSKIRGNYGFYLKIWDRLFNTMLPGTMTIVAKVSNQCQSAATGNVLDNR